jgi:uncharacterized membrane protein
MQEYRPSAQEESYLQGYQTVDGPASFSSHMHSDQLAHVPAGNFYGHEALLPLRDQQANYPAPLPRSDTCFIATLTYSFGWLSGLFFTLFSRENRYIRFHALQSLIFFGLINVVDIAFLFMSAGLRYFLHFIGPMFFPMHFLGLMLFLGFLLVNGIAFIGWLIAIVQAYSGSYYRLPLVGNMVARALHMQPPLK